MDSVKSVRATYKRVAYPTVHSNHYLCEPLDINTGRPGTGADQSIQTFQPGELMRTTGLWVIARKGSEEILSVPSVKR